MQIAFYVRFPHSKLYVPVPIITLLVNSFVIGYGIRFPIAERFHGSCPYLITTILHLWYCK
jgi:hypothetical protein